MNVARLFNLFLPVLFVGMACSTTSNTKQDSAVDSHTSQNSLDWAGVYTGDGTLLVLDESHTYWLEEKIAPDSITRQTGSFQWDADGRNIELANGKKKYWIRENNIVPIDDNNQAVAAGELKKELSVLSGVYWRLIEVKGQDATVLKSGFEREAYLQFDQAQKLVSGNSGCNQIFGGYEAETEPAGKITIGQLGSTMMMCPSMELEKIFTETIVHVSQFQLDNAGMLILKDNTDAPLFKFRRGLFKE